MNSIDVISLLALELDLKSLFNLCLTCKKYYDRIWLNDFFWKNKMEKDRPEIFSKFFIGQTQIIPIKECKNIYIKLYTSNCYSVFIDKESTFCISGYIPNACLIYKSDVIKPRGYKISYKGHQLNLDNENINYKYDFFIDNISFYYSGIRSEKIDSFYKIIEKEITLI